MSDLFDDAPGLSPIAQQVAECYAVVYPECPGRSKAMQWINRARKRSLNEPGFKAPQITAAVDELVTLELLEPSIDSQRGVVSRGPMARHGMITRFSRQAVVRGTAQVLLEELDTSHGQDPYRYARAADTGAFLEQRVRIALLSDRFKPFETAHLPLGIWSWMTEDDAADLISRLPIRHRITVCNFGLAWLSHHLMPIDTFAEQVEQHAPGALAKVILARARIVQGRFPNAEALLDEVVESDGDDIFFQMESLALRAMAAMILGDDKTACRMIDTCVELERVGTRKRYVYPNNASFSLPLFSLVRLNTPESRALMKKLLTAHAKLRIESDIHPLLLAADSADQPVPERVDLYQPGSPDFDAVLHAIASRWHVRYHFPEEHVGARQWIERTALQAAAGGYAWALAEMLTVLEQQVGDTDMLDPQVQALMQEADGAARLRQLGATTLTHLVHTVEPWEYALRELEQLAPKTGKGKRKTDKAQDSRRKRLIWQIEAIDDRLLDVVPIEQSVGKNGQWSTGRKVALKRLQEKADTMPHLIDQDIKAGRSIQKHSGYWGEKTSYVTTPRTLFQLIGHPHVYDDEGNRVDVVERAPVLSLAESANGLRLTVVPERLGSGAGYQSELDRANRRLNVTHFTAAQSRIEQIIPISGLKLPREADERLHQLLNALSGDISVQGESEVADASVIEGNSDPLLAIEPVGDALQVRIRVEPLADSGHYFDAGSGGAIVYVQGDNGTVAVQRDLEAERSRVEHLITLSDVLATHYDGRPHMIIDEPMEALELLEQAREADIRCLWPDNIPFRIKARAGVSQMRLDIKSGTEWFAASGTLDLGDGEEPLALARLQQLMAARRNSRFVELGKGEFLALSDTLKQQLDTLQAFSQPARGEKSPPQTHPMALLALEPLLDEADIKADKRWKTLRKRVEQALSSRADLPAALEADLRSYQQQGFDWLARLGQLGAGACLADDMGLGKTLQALTLLLSRADGGPALVVAPTSVLGNWQQEAQRFTPTLNVQVYVDAGAQRRDLLTDLAAFDVIVVSYGLLVNDIDHFQPIHWHSVVLDEAQAIRNATTQRARCVRQLQADFRMATTGTPVQNNLMDLHSLFGFLNPRLLGSEAAFRKRFALPISRDQDEQARQQLQALVAPFLMRRHKREVLKELPARTELVLDVALSPEEAQTYEALREEALEALQSGDDAQSLSQQKFNMLASLTRLRRLCCHPSLVVPDWTGPASKLSVFAETLEELLAGGHKALVFSQFVDHLKIVERHLQAQSISYQYIDGSVSAKQRTARVARFQHGEGDVFLISLTAGGTGLNLTAADYVIHLDPWWNPAVEDQASDRAHRLGQQRPVTIVRMVTTGTVEEQIQALHGSKRDLADAVLAGADSPTLDADTLLGLLRGG